MDRGGGENARSPSPASRHFMTDTSRRFAFFIASAREAGNTEALARAAAAALPAGTEQRWLRLADLPLTPFVDIRHESGVYPQPRGHEATLADATLWATDIVIVSPIYWYSLTASAKHYLDWWSGWMRVPGLDFRARMAGKGLWGVTVTSDDVEVDDQVSAPLVGTLRLTADYLKMHWRGMLLGHGNKPGDIAGDTAAFERARAFFG
jgi:multimeric flavodoxin WrbA